MQRRAVVLWTVILLCLLFVSTAFSQNKLESWYTYWGLGYANPTYPDEIEDLLDQIEDLDDVDHITVALDFLGFYWPLQERTILGGIINAFGDRYDIAGQELQLTGFTIAFSAMHFLTNRIGQGLFVRGDIGPTRFALDVEGEDTETTDWGLGGLLGAGYGIPVSEGTRILLNVNYAFRRVEGENVNTLGITLGGLF